MGRMSAGYGQFCPIAKASEIFATRWTPLIVREVMTGVHSFNDIHRGVPLISRAVLVARLRELEDHGVIERRPRGADMIRHRRDRELNALACKLLALPVERLMIGIFVDQDHRQQAWPGEAACDRMEGSGRLTDLLARAAAELLPYMLGHKPLPRHHIERLGDVFADLGELAAAATRTGGRRRVDDAPARQIGGKVAPRRLTARE